MLLTIGPVLFCEICSIILIRDCSAFPPLPCVCNAILSTTCLTDSTLTDGFAIEIMNAIWSTNSWETDPKGEGGGEVGETAVDSDVDPYAILDRKSVV